MIEAYFGEGFTGHVPETGILALQDAGEQFITLASVARSKGISFGPSSNDDVDAKAVFLHFPYWTQHSFADFTIADSQHDDLLSRLARRWENRFPDIILCRQGHLVGSPQ